jgi:hypothetical protein
VPTIGSPDQSPWRSTDGAHQRRIHETIVAGLRKARLNVTGRTTKAFFSFYPWSVGNLSLRIWKLCSTKHSTSRKTAKEGRDRWWFDSNRK